MSIRVLVADDHNLVRQALVKLLQEQEGVEVVGDVESGRAAVRAAKDTRPDVVIMDVTMPDLNGIDATRQIRIAVPNAKILALSMHREQPLLPIYSRPGHRGIS